MFNFTKHNWTFLLIALGLMLLSLFFIFQIGLRFGIDFQGGSQFEMVFLKEPISKIELEQTLTQPEFEQFQLGTIFIQEIGDQHFIIRTREITLTTHANVIESLREQGFEIEDKGMVTVSAIVGQEMQQSSMIVVAIALLFMIIYITLAFYRLKAPIKNWQYGLVVFFTLIHDLVVTLGTVALLGYFYGLEITIPIMVAFLTILGYSVNDTIVIFDRIRENLTISSRVTNNPRSFLNRQDKLNQVKLAKEIQVGKISPQTEAFSALVNKSLNQVVIRSLGTSITTLLALSALFFLGGEIVRNFALVLMIGITLGTYSSFFIASQLLIILSRLKKQPSAIVQKITQKT